MRYPAAPPVLFLPALWRAFLVIIRRMTDIKGVNLGGWLLLERWMTPSLFAGSEATDEYSLSGLVDRTIQQRIRDHREGFITEETISQLAKLGLNTVRLPVGYWLFDSNPPFIAGGDKYVDLALNWCDKYGIKMILDVHGAPGSQNGWDHSGMAGTINWDSPENVSRTLYFISQLMERFGDHHALAGVEVLNEPKWLVPIETLVNYYRRAYDLIRAKNRNITIYFSDAFRPKDMAIRLENEKMDRICLDVHLYQLYTDEDRSLNLKQHIRKVDKQWRRELKGLGKRLPVVVGEWSAAMHEQFLDVAQPEHALSYSSDDYYDYFQAQKNIFESVGVGWVYWTAKTEDGGPWSLLDNQYFLK